MLQKRYEPPRGRLARIFARPPFRDARGEKGRWTKFSRAQNHKVQHLSLKIDGWPRWSRPLRVVFISDLHTGSHTDDVERLKLIVDDAARVSPDLVLFGGDYVNMQPFGGGRVPPQITAAILARLYAPLGCYAVLGNHDYIYGADDVADALKHHGMTVLENARRAIKFEDQWIQIAGIPDAHVVRPESHSILGRLSRAEPTIVLSHDPVWFRHLPPGPHLMLAGHTHGGQIRFPVIGPITNASKAPLRWSYGLVEEDGRLLYVTSGIGTSGVPIRWGIPPELVVLDLIGKP
jgi:uncharacterized protein